MSRDCSRQDFHISFILNIERYSLLNSPNTPLRTPKRFPVRQLATPPPTTFHDRRGVTPSTSDRKQKSRTLPTSEPTTSDASLPIRPLRYRNPKPQSSYSTPHPYRTSSGLRITPDSACTPSSTYPRRRVSSATILSDSSSQDIKEEQDVEKMLRVMRPPEREGGVKAIPGACEALTSQLIPVGFESPQLNIFQKCVILNPHSSSPA